MTNKKIATALLLAMSLNTIYPSVKSYAIDEKQPSIANSVYVANKISEEKAQEVIQLEQEVESARADLQKAVDTLKEKESEKITIDQKLTEAQNDYDKALRNKDLADKDLLKAMEKQTEASDAYIDLAEKKEKQENAANELEKAQTDLSNAQREQKEAEVEVDQAKEEISLKEEDLRQAQQALEAATVEKKQQEELNRTNEEKNNVAKEEYDKAKKQLEEAEKNSESILDDKKIDIAEAEKKLKESEKTLDNSRNSLNEKQKNVEELYKDLQKYQTDNPDLRKLKEKLKKEEEYLKWLLPGSDGYNMKKAEVDSLKSQIENISDTKEKVKEKSIELNNAANQYIDIFREYNDDIGSFKANTSEQSNKKANNQMIDELLAGETTSSNIDQKIEEAIEKTKALYSKQISAKYDYETVNDEYSDAWLEVSKATDGFRDSYAQLYDWNWADNSSYYDIKKQLTKLEDKFNKNIDILSNTTSELKEKEEAYKNAISEYEQAKAYENTLRQSKDLIASYESNQAKLEDLKKAATEADENYKKIQTEVEKARKNLEEKKKQVETKQISVKDAENTLAAKKKNLKVAQDKKSMANQKVKDLEEKISELSNYQADEISNEKLEAAKKSYEAAKNEVNKAIKDINDKIKDVEDSKIKLEEAKNKKIAAEKAVEKAQTDVDKANTKLKIQEDKLLTAKDKKVLTDSLKSLEKLLEESKKLGDKDLNTFIKEVEPKLKKEKLTIDEIISLNNKLTTEILKAKVKASNSNKQDENANESSNGSNKPLAPNKDENSRNPKTVDKETNSESSSSINPSNLIYVPKGYKYIKEGYYKRADLESNLIRLKKALAYNQYLTESARKLLNKYPKTIKPIKNELLALILESEALQAKAMEIVAEYEQVLN